MGNGGKIVRMIAAVVLAGLASTAAAETCRESMAMSAGMLFVYPEPQAVGFWMKNTLIPLDMIFMDETGTVKKVHHEAQPLDESPIFGGQDILAVLEINGGLARKIGISEGWTMRHAAIDQSKAAWPCSESQ